MFYVPTRYVPVTLTAEQKQRLKEFFSFLTKTEKAEETEVSENNNEEVIENGGC